MPLGTVAMSKAESMAQTAVGMQARDAGIALTHLYRKRTEEAYSCHRKSMKDPDKYIGLKPGITKAAESIQVSRSSPVPSRRSTG